MPQLTDFLPTTRKEMELRGWDEVDVILFSGDAYNYEQLNPSGKIDLFVPHLAVGLNMPKAIEKINPSEVLMSHILELGHSITQWRWSYEYGINECEKLEREGVYLPVWGEMIRLKR